MYKLFSDLFAKYLSQRRHVKKGICQKVLGNTGSLGAFSVFWREHGDLLEQVVAVKLNEFVSEQDFTQKELMAFRAGLTTIPLFFMQSWQETEQNRLQENQDTIELN